MTANTNNSANGLRRLPWLADPLLKFDLVRELQDLRGTVSWKRKTGRSSKTLAKHPDFRLVLVLMKAGTQMNQYQAEGRISIHLLLGSLRVRLQEREVNLQPGELLVLDGCTTHDIEAREESAFVLSISWHKRRKSHREPAGYLTQQNFDEQAQLRMEDEGGASAPPGRS